MKNKKQCFIALMRTCFFVCRFGCANEIECTENRARKKKFVQPWTFRTSNAWLSNAIFVSDVCCHISQITLYSLLVVVFWCASFLVCTMALLSSVDKDSTEASPDSFITDFVLACKIKNQMQTNFENRNVPQAVSGKIYVLFYLALKFLENMFELSIDLFQRKFTLTWKIY